MPLEKFPAFLMQSEVVQMHAIEAVTRTFGREPEVSLALSEVSENQIDAEDALDPERAFDVGLKYPKKKPSMKMKTLPVVGPGVISPKRFDPGIRFLTTDDIWGAR